MSSAPHATRCSQAGPPRDGRAEADRQARMASTIPPPPWPCRLGCRCVARLAPTLAAGRAPTVCRRAKACTALPRVTRDEVPDLARRVGVFARRESARARHPRPTRPRARCHLRAGWFYVADRRSSAMSIQGQGELNSADVYPLGSAVLESRARQAAANNCNEFY